MNKWACDITGVCAVRRVRRATSASASGTARSGACASVLEQLEPYSFLLVLKATSGAMRAYLKPYIALERPRSRNRLLMLGEQSLAPLETIRTNGTASPFNACFDPSFQPEIAQRHIPFNYD